MQKSSSPLGFFPLHISLTPVRCSVVELPLLLRLASLSPFELQLFYSCSKRLLLGLLNQNRMEDSRSVVVQAPAVVERPSAGDVNIPAPQTAGSVSDGNSGLDSLVSSTGAVYDGSNPGEEILYGHVAVPVTQDAVLGAYEPKPDDGATNAGDHPTFQDNVADPHAQGVVGSEPLKGSTMQMTHYQATGISANGNAQSDVGAPAAEQHYKEFYTPEEERLWGLVRVNCLDFNAWTALIEETEKVAENNIPKIRKVYDAFLAEFPLCFGYWRKYADHEGRLDSIEKVVEVYERAVLAVTYSVDIWLHYCVFAISTYGDMDTIRRLFERGLAYVGSDYLAYPLWDEYIRYEESHQTWSHLATIYTRILENPIQQIDRYFNCFKELAIRHPLSEIQTAEEATILPLPMENGSHGLEDEVHPDGVEQSSKESKPVSAGVSEAEELEKYIAIREEMYRKAKEFDSKIIGFETAIRRPYFHVKPLDDPELENWHNYLDFIERGNDFNKVVKLYERCLIACANYSEYWIRYVLCMEAGGGMELALNALARAAQVFVKKQPEIHLFAARFKELSGDVLGARTEYRLLYSEISPCLLEAIVKRANMEYRLGNKEDAYSVYEDVIVSEQEKEQSAILPLLVVQYARFLSLVAGDSEKARQILDGPLQQMQLSKSILEAVIHLESIQPSQKRVDYLDSLVEKFIVPNPENSSLARTADREDISCIFMEFLDLFGDAQSIKKAGNRHALLFLRQKSMSVSKKRHAEDFLASDKAKIAKDDSVLLSSSQSIMGAYPNAEYQWDASYAQQPTTWPQITQAQGQQWNPGYAEQGVYTGYSGYANYPQMPASVPQSVAYNAYPQTYPIQSYAQPAAVAISFPQQQAPIQPNYSGYY